MAWYNASWLYRVKVTVQSAQVDETATGFPIYVDLSDLPSDFHTNVKSDGSDIRVTESDGSTEVPREVVFYDAGADDGELHFLGGVSASVDTDFYIYYGNAGASEPSTSATYGRNAVWENYHRVYHFHESMVDSSGNQDATNNGSTDVSAQIGKGRDLDGVNDQITIGGVAGLVDNFAIEWIINADETGEPDQRIIAASSLHAPHDFIGFRLNNAGLQAWDGSTWRSFGQSLSAAAGWQHLCFSYGANSGGSLTAHTMVDGVAGSGGTHSTTADGITYSDTTLGSTYGGTYGTRGDYQTDEFRIHKSQPSDDFLTTSYNNLMDVANFISVGTQEVNGESDERSATIEGINSLDANYFDATFTPAEVEENDERAATTIGQDSDSDERSATITGSDAENSEQSAKITGQDAQNDERLSKIVGQESESDTREAKITGQQIDASERNAALQGQNSDSATRGAIITGEQAENDERSATVVGKQSDSSEYSATITGQDSDTEDRQARLLGQQLDNEERAATVTGQDSDSATRGATTTGQDSDSDERQGRLVGQQLDSDNRSAATHGKASAISQLSAFIRGSLSAASEVWARLTGKDTSQSDRQTSITGKDQAAGEVGAKIRGSQDDAEEVAATLHGQDLAQSSRGASITGRITRSRPTIIKSNTPGTTIGSSSNTTELQNNNPPTTLNSNKGGADLKSKPPTTL